MGKTGFVYSTNIIIAETYSKKNYEPDPKIKKPKKGKK